MTRRLIWPRHRRVAGRRLHIRRFLSLPLGEAETTIRHQRKRGVQTAHQSAMNARKSRSHG